MSDGGFVDEYLYKMVKIPVNTHVRSSKSVYILHFIGNLLDRILSHKVLGFDPRFSPSEDSQSKFSDGTVTGEIGNRVHFMYVVGNLFY